MIGTIKKVVAEKSFAFIKTATADYFLHRSNFDGHWEDLIDDFEKGIEVPVEFEPVRSDKGLRAEECRRTDNG